MKEELNNNYTDNRKIGYSKADAIKLDTKCLYAGKLERIKQWHEKPHKHSTCEIMFVLSGRGETVIEGKNYKIKKGDIIIYNPNVMHEESTSAQMGFELAFFGITNFKINDLPQDYLVGEDCSPVLHSGDEEEQFRFYFMTLTNEARDETQYNDLIVKYLARLILIGILRLANISEAKFVTNTIFLQIHQYLNKNFANIESMEQICNDLHVSKYYISHVFKKYLGKPPMQYVTSLRIANAKKLLQETDLSASEIGEMCGYQDHVLFFKTFKKIEGITPIAFRKKTYSTGVTEYSKRQ